METPKYDDGTVEGGILSWVSANAAQVSEHIDCDPEDVTHAVEVLAHGARLLDQMSR